MKLDKLEKIQLFYDSVGSLFCAFILGIICSLFVNFSSIPEAHRTFWEYFHLFLPFVFYPIFLFVFWKNSAFKNYRLNLLWILINFFSTITTLLFSFLIRDIVNNRLLTDQSKFLPFNRFVSIVGAICAVLQFFAFFFWFFGAIHRFLAENRKYPSTLGLKIND